MRNFPSCHKGQGATEYLVLLAVVLIVALVSVALLGFFPGMASDAQLTQSQVYWQGASPIAIYETAARYDFGWAQSSDLYLALRNNGAYPIRITKFLGGTNSSAYQFVWSGVKNITDYYYLAPGAELVLSGDSFGKPGFNAPFVKADSPNSVGTYYFSAASTMCQNSTTAPGILQINNFGLEYIEYLDNNQQITKRQIGTKPLIVKCREPV